MRKKEYAAKWTGVGSRLKMMIRTDDCLGDRPQGCVVGPDPGLHLSHSDFTAAPKLVSLLQFCLSLIWPPKMVGKIFPKCKYE